MARSEGRWPRASPSLLRSLLGAAVVLLSVNIAVADDLQQLYCSPQNTGSDYDGPDLTSIYQSNGRCTTNCTTVAPGSAFAIVQGENCWCGNYIPADQQPVSECSVPCVGYPYESCGNADTGLFGYLQIGTPSGTQGASLPSSSPDTSDSTSDETSSPAQAQTVVNSFTVTTERTITPPRSVSVSIFTHTPPRPSTRQTTTTTPTTRSSRTTSSDSDTTTSSTTPVTSVQILTVSNQPVTQTVTSMPTIPAADPNSQQPIQQKSSVSAGLIAGVVIAAVVAALALAGLLFFCWRRRRQQQELEASTANTMVGSGTPSSRPTRNTSVLSKTGLLERVYPSAAAAQRPHANSANSNPNSSNTQEMTGGVSPISERRRSQPLFYDQRLNPTTLMNYDNGSRVSVNTLPDDRDFSRTLNVRNPDPHDSWQ